MKNIGIYIINIVIDLDDTICFPNHEFKDTTNKYALAKPNEPIIEKLRELKLKGVDITIFSSRRMVTHNGDLEKIEEDVGLVTRIWLEKYDVPYDNLLFGKPYSSTYYVDDKALSPEKFVLNDLSEFI